MMIIKFLKASCGDCILISFKEDQGEYRNILIDGGMSSTYLDAKINEYGELKREIEGIKNRNQNIDLLILTHIDQDHIGGLLKWFSEEREEAYKIIDRIWFNSGKLIAEYLKHEENRKLQLKLDSQAVYTSIDEGIDFEKYLLEKKIWERELILQGKSWEQWGIKLTVLSPTVVKLDALLAQYKAKYPDVYTGGKKTDWNKSLMELIYSGSVKSEVDNSETNGSSIAFILSYKGKNMLFLGDAHANVIIQALTDLQYSEDNPLVAEFVKLSHHGSKKNTVPKLLKLIKTDNYIVSTDGAHGHPDKITLARIVNLNSAAHFYFNYPEMINIIFTKKDWSDFPDLRCYGVSVYKVEYEE